MERKIYLIIISLVLFFGTSIAQTDYKYDIYDCFVNNKMTEWKDIIDKIEKKQYKTNPQTLELINFQYGYIAWCLGNDKNDEAETYLELAIKNAEKLENINLYKSIIYSYKSAFWGFKIGLAFYKAPFLGPESIKFAEKSIELNDENYFGYIQLGNIEYYMPSAFGGSKTKALEYYLKALKLMEKQTIENDWNYLSLLIIIAQAYEGTENYSKAKEYYNKVLKIEPDLSWVENELLPELNKKIKDNE